MLEHRKNTGTKDHRNTGALEYWDTGKLHRRNSATWELELF